jgi:steroid 5-alpha reductase family enzyme
MRQRASGFNKQADAGVAAEGGAAEEAVALPGRLVTAAETFINANALGFAISFLSRISGHPSHAHLDLIGSGAFVIAAAKTHGNGDIQQMLSAACIGVWGCRLAFFLFYRAVLTGHDGRLEAVLSTVDGEFGFWFVSCLWGVVCTLPHTLSVGRGHPRGSVLGPSAWVGLGLFLLGFSIEVLADYQKFAFKSSLKGVAGEAAFCNIGLWGVSQHPNYVGDLLVWVGILIQNVPLLAGGARWGRARLLLAALSPLFMLALFWSQASGAATNTQELAETKYGADPRYQEYVRTVPLMVPGF